LTGMPKRRGRSETEYETLWEVVLACSRTGALIDFGVEQLRGAYLQRGRSVHVETAPDVHKLDADVRLEIDPQADLPADGFAFGRSRGSLHLTAVDERGAMYSLLEVADVISAGRRFEQIEPARHEPTLKLRGFKFNIPIEPLFGAPPVQPDTHTFWSLEFWREFIDALARHRFNMLGLWSRNPFPWMFPLPRWPQAHQMSDQQLEERRQFWNGLFDHCLARGVDPYIIAADAHLPRNVVQGLGLADEHRTSLCRPLTGTEQPEGETVAKYYRQSIRTLLTTYQQVQGLGILAGPETLDDEAQRERWLIDAWLAGVAEAGREVNLLRCARTSQQARAVVEQFVPSYDGPVLLGLEPTRARLLSRPQAVCEELKAVTSDQTGQDVPISYILGQEDVHRLRWADAGFVRRTIAAVAEAGAAGMQFGLDGHAWLQDPYHRQPDPAWQWEFQKHEDQLCLWGRAAYDKELSDRAAWAVHTSRYGQQMGEQLAKALQTASRIIPAVNRQIGGHRRWRWQGETCLSQLGLRSIIDLAFAEPAAGCGTVSIGEYAQAKLAGQTVQGETPPAIIDLLTDAANATLACVESLETAARADRGLWSLLRDLEAMACLGNYYAFKIAAAVELNLYRLGRRSAARMRAQQMLATSAGWWQRLAANGRERFDSVKIGLLMLPFGWWLYEQDVQRDLLLAEQFEPDYDRPPSAPGGRGPGQPASGGGKTAKDQP
jgi:hypothetical protein